MVASNAQHWIPKTAEVVSRILRQDRRAHGYHLHSRDAEVPQPTIFSVVWLTLPSPEAVLVLRSISSLETLYLNRSTNRMNEAVNSATMSYLSARGNPPGPGDGVAIARIVVSELDSARFDPLLVRTVARNAGRVMDGLISKIDGMVRVTAE